tara:strand:+ start:616 stop:1050 length:435 start_codon:yes stop_codon:yes gene_type:complete
MLYFIGDKQIYVNQSFKTADGATVCKQWFTALTDSEKSALKIEEKSVPAAKDGRFYDSVGNALAVSDVKAEMLKDDTQTAQIRLSETDWYIVRKTEVGTAVPDSVTTLRAAIRTVHGQRETAINACTSVAELEAAEPNLTAWPS